MTGSNGKRSNENSKNQFVLAHFYANNKFDGRKTYDELTFAQFVVPAVKLFAILSFILVVKKATLTIAAIISCKYSSLYCQQNHVKN